jgi:competence protein ComFC
LQSRFYRAAWKFLDILFPPCCAGCGEWGERYCKTCFATTKTINPNICQICGEPIGLETGSTCKRCKTTDIYFTAVRSWALFEDPLKFAIHKLKYQRNIGLGEVLAEPLARLLFDCDWDIDLITAIPLDMIRKQERGFNQSVLLARPLSWASKIPFNEKAVTRSQNTRSQVGLSRDERKENMAGAFRSDTKIVKGKSILVIDDVITTGSTINACSKAMIEAGVEHVYGMTLARSVHP